MQKYVGSILLLSFFLFIESLHAQAPCPLRGSCNLEPGLANRTDLMMFEDFEMANWLTHWSDVAFPTNMSAVATPSFSGRSLEVRAPQGSHDGATLAFDYSSVTGSEPDEGYARYYIRFNSTWQRTGDGEIGKLPGFEGTYGRCGWGGRRSDGTCWSARMMNFDRGATNQIGFYTYHADMGGNYGEHMVWTPQLQRDRWYCIEQKVRLNSVGSSDGQLEGWVDGVQAFTRSNLRFRMSSTVHLEGFWFNIYIGGNNVADQNMALHFDNLVISRNRIGCMNGPVVVAPRAPTRLRIVN